MKPQIYYKNLKNVFFGMPHIDFGANSPRLKFTMSIEIV